MIRRRRRGWHSAASRAEKQNKTETAEGVNRKQKRRDWEEDWGFVFSSTVELCFSTASEPHQVWLQTQSAASTAPAAPSYSYQPEQKEGWNTPLFIRWAHLVIVSDWFPKIALKRKSENLYSGGSFIKNGDEASKIVLYCRQRDPPLQLVRNEETC